MGNKEITRQLEGTVHTNFAEESNWNKAYEGPTLEECEKFFQSIDPRGGFYIDQNKDYLSKKMRECFPNHSSVDFGTSITDATRWDT